MAGLDPVIHAFRAAGAACAWRHAWVRPTPRASSKAARPAQAKSWMPGPSPGMTRGQRWSA